MVSVSVSREEELESVARDVLSTLKRGGANVIALRGDLGVGKTAFTKALARTFNIPEHVTSPTFVIMKSYAIHGDDTFDTLTHIDAYRIDEEHELAVLHFKEILQDKKQLVVIEWPERIPGLIPENALVIDLRITTGTERLITYEE